MARPRLHYIVINMGKAESVIYDGRHDAAIRVAHLQAFEMSACYLSFRSRLAAEEFVTWWTYEREGA